MTELSVQTFGAATGPELVFLHGVTSHGRHARRLAEEADGLAGHWHVIAPDLLGHGHSPDTPPWTIAHHVEAVLETVGRDRRVWIGHSFGGRLAFEIAARSPECVDRLVLLDPAIQIPAHVARFAAEQARPDRSYASFDEAIERRFDESQLHRATRDVVSEELAHHLHCDTDDRWRYRYTQSVVVATYGELASTPPPFTSVDVPTLLVLGELSYVSYDHLLPAHRAAAGELLTVVTVPGGHTVLWDAFEETSAAIRAFLASDT